MSTSSLAWWGGLLLLFSFLLFLAHSSVRWLATSGIDRVCAYLHFRTSRLKLSLRPRRIFLIRHGESQGNVDRLCYQHTPDNLIQLTQHGREQASEAGRRLKELIGCESVLFYVSPFLRSQQTFHILSQHFSPHQFRVREDPRIREQEWGNSQLVANMASVLQERERVGKFFFRFQDGESGADVFDRVSSFMESMFREMQNDYPVQNMVLVSHGLFMRLFLQRFYRWSVDRFSHLANPDNCEFYLLQRDGPHAGFTLKTPIRTYGDKQPTLPLPPDQPTDTCAAASSSSPLSFPATPTPSHPAADPHSPSPDSADHRRGQLLRASLTQPLPSDADLHAQQPDLRPALSCPTFQGRMGAPVRHSRVRSMQAEHDAFSPRLTSQSLLKGTFGETGESFRLHEGDDEGERERAGRETRRRSSSRSQRGADAALMGARGDVEFEEGQKEEQRGEESEEEYEAQALTRRRQRDTD